MRECVIRANEELQPILSKDLGAISSLLLDVGVEKITLDQNWEKTLQLEKEKREKALKKRHVEYISSWFLAGLSTRPHPRGRYNWRNAGYYDIVKSNKTLHRFSLPEKLL